jgi:hypothetical protein
MSVAKMNWSEEALDNFIHSIVIRDRQQVIGFLAKTEFTSLDHMPHEAELPILDLPIPTFKEA